MFNIDRQFSSELQLAEKYSIIDLKFQSADQSGESLRKDVERSTKTHSECSQYKDGQSRRRGSMDRRAEEHTDARTLNAG